MYGILQLKARTSKPLCKILLNYVVHQTFTLGLSPKVKVWWTTTILIKSKPRNYFQSYSLPYSLSLKGADLQTVWMPV